MMRAYSSELNPASVADSLVYLRRHSMIRDDVPDQWMDDALCAQTDPELFTPDKGGSNRDAKRVCGSCEVRAQCLEWALRNNERTGIYGGLSARERVPLHRAFEARRDAA